MSKSSPKKRPSLKWAIMSFFNISTSLLTSCLVFIVDQWKLSRSIVQTSSKRRIKSPPFIPADCDLSDPTEMTKEEIAVLSAIDLDEYYVDEIMAHEEKGRNPKNWNFKVRWVGYEPEHDSWLN